MNYGLYTAASGLLTSLYKMDVQANNLANVETPGFKFDTPATRQRLAARPEDGLWQMPSNPMLERLGAGVMLAPTRVSQTQGALQTTGNPLDLAIEGPGYLVVRQRGPGGELHLTRDGRLAQGPRGELVQASTGLPVMDKQDRPIILPPGQAIDVAADGTLSVDGRPAASVQVVVVPQAGRLRKVGDNLLAADAGALAKRAPALGRVRQGFIERSNVDPVRTMIEVTKADRAVGAASKLMQIQDDLLSRTINVFGRVA